MLEKLQRWCAYLFLVTLGTLAGALVLARLGTWLGAAPPAPGEADPLTTAVIALVMAMTGFGIAWLFLAVLTEIAWDARPALARLRGFLARRERRTLALWAAAAIAAGGLAAGLW
jgi:hypothetical protein